MIASVCLLTIFRAELLEGVMIGIVDTRTRWPAISHRRWGKDSHRTSPLPELRMDRDDSESKSNWKQLDAREARFNNVLARGERQVKRKFDR